MGSRFYRYNMQVGHYVHLNEEELMRQEQQNQAQEQQQQEQQQVDKTQIVNLESSDVSAMRQEKANKLKEIQDQIKIKQDNVIQCQEKVNANANGTDQAILNSLQSTYIQAMKELADKKFEYYKLENEYDNKIFQLQKKLVESMQSAYLRIPEKYRGLNESNIQNAKIHVTKLIDDDVQERIKGMVDFKKAFSKSDLLYGKDKEGFYAVCVDEDDLNKLTNTLMEIGYLKDDIYSVVLSQVFDRSGLVK